MQEDFYPFVFEFPNGAKLTRLSELVIVATFPDGRDDRWEFTNAVSANAVWLAAVVPA